MDALVVFILGTVGAGVLWGLLQILSNLQDKAQAEQPEEAHVVDDIDYED